MACSESSPFKAVDAVAVAIDTHRRACSRCRNRTGLSDSGRCPEGERLADEWEEALERSCAALGRDAIACSPEGQEDR